MTRSFSIAVTSLLFLVRIHVFVCIQQVQLLLGTFAVPHIVNGAFLLQRIPSTEAYCPANFYIRRPADSKFLPPSPPPSAYRVFSLTHQPNQHGLIIKDDGNLR
ncbi:hypothetical protein BS17DRAFT_782409 [Gyrodon lividus]|nr:hypothetical protein BS17DRAFT_782409 [Gyrodon lividus]